MVNFMRHLRAVFLPRMLQGFSSSVLTGLVLSALSGCTSSDEKANTSKLLSEADQKKVDDFRAEVEVGRNMAGRMLAFYGALDNPAIINYVNRVGSFVGTYSDYPDRRYMVHILNTDQVNAFACPGGYILITMGLLKNVKNEAELAAILGHEVAHVGRQHMFNFLKTMNKKEMEDRVKKLDEKSRIDFPESVLVRKRPEANESETGALVARYLAGSSGAGLSIIQTASAGMSVILETGLDKALEYEADKEGIKYAIRAGYAPYALPAFLKRLGDKKKALNMAVLEKTHPTAEDRIKSMTGVLTELDAKNIVGAFGTERFVKVRNLLPQNSKKNVTVQ